MACFTADTFKVYEKNTGSLVTEYLSVSGGAADGSVDIVTSDESLVGTHVVEIKTVVLENSEEVYTQDLTIDIINACFSSSVAGSVVIEP